MMIELTRIKNEERRNWRALIMIQAIRKVPIIMKKEMIERKTEEMIGGMIGERKDKAINNIESKMTKNRVVIKGDKEMIGDREAEKIEIPIIEEIIETILKRIKKIKNLIQTMILGIMTLKLVIVIQEKYVRIVMAKITLEEEAEAAKEAKEEEKMHVEEVVVPVEGIVMIIRETAQFIKMMTIITQSENQTLIKLEEIILTMKTKMVNQIEVAFEEV